MNFFPRQRNVETGTRMTAGVRTVRGERSTTHGCFESAGVRECGEPVRDRVIEKIEDAVDGQEELAVGKGDGAAAGESECPELDQETCWDRESL